MLWKQPQKRIYLDHASATPIRKEVRNAMEPYFSELFGNAGAIHTEGTTARRAITNAREKLAHALRIRPEGIFFTGSGTESNNLAILGTIAKRHAQGIGYQQMEVISTAIEHPSVLEALEHATSMGVQVKYIEVDETGIIDAHALKNALTKNTVLVSFAYVNSEVGTIQFVGKLARIIRAQEKEFSSRIYVHVDAAQAPLWLSCALDSLSVDMVSLDAGKCCGPKGIGVLVCRHGVELSPVIFGGGQEGGLRSGTENTPLIIGAVEAICIAQQDYIQRSKSVCMLRDAFITALCAIEGVELNGSYTTRVANNVNISLRDVDSEFAVITLDEQGIACSTKSACASVSGEGSVVVLALTNDRARANTTIRFSLGEDTTQQELDTVVRVLQTHITSTRESIRKLTSR